MTMQTDVLASAVRSTSGVMQDQKGRTVGRCRIKAIFINNNGNFAVVNFYNGSSNTGSVLFQGFCDGLSTGYNWMPGEGILATDGVYIDIVGTAVPNVVVLYG